MTSLQGRLQLGLSGALMLLMLLLWWLASSNLNHIAEQMLSSRLEHDGEALLASLQRDPTDSWYIKESQVGHIYQRVFSGHYFTISIEGQQLRSRSLWDVELPQRELPSGKTITYQLDGPDGQLLLVWQAGYVTSGHLVSISVAEDITPMLDSLQHFTGRFALAAILILVILLLLQRWLIRRSFRSLANITDELEALSGGEIESLSATVPNEVKPLVVEVNRLLQLLSQRLQRSRNAMGNLAHSLKHPLNLLMQLAEKSELDSVNRQDLVNNTQQIYQLMERELKRARLAGGGVPGQRFKANEELPALVDVLKRVYHEKSINIDYQIDADCEYPADRNDMLELLGNLLDNACKWADRQVGCALRCNGSLEITITDDGTGCDQEQLQQLTERGVRIDESVSGSGLGLAIVKEIVELYDGELQFNTLDKGGLQVRVILP